MNLCEWLPELEQCTDISKYTEYEEILYSIFKQDFIDSKPMYDGKPVNHRFYPSENGKAEAFYHIISKTNPNGENRSPDFRRCERIRWVKPYKIDTIGKANIEDRYSYTFDGIDTIYYVENNNVYSVNARTKNTVINADELTIDNDEMTLSDFKIKNIFCDTNTGELYVRGSYSTVNTAKEINNNYLYSVNNGISVITDNFPDMDVIGVLNNGDYFEGFNIINGTTFEVEDRLRNGAQEGFIESGNNLYYWAYYGKGSGYLYEYNYVDGKTAWTAPINVYCAGFTNDSVVLASDNSLHTYNFSGKEINKITADDYEVTDKTKVNFSNAQSFRLAVTKDNSIIFYDTSAKAFRMITRS